MKTMTSSRNINNISPLYRASGFAEVLVLILLAMTIAAFGFRFYDEKVKSEASKQRQIELANAPASAAIIEDMGLMCRKAGIAFSETEMASMTTGEAGAHRSICLLKKWELEGVAERQIEAHKRQEVIKALASK